MKYLHKYKYLPLLFSCSLLAFADQIQMKNGDRVTGSIVKKDATTLTIKSTHFGTVTLPWAEVESVKADTPLSVVLPDGRTLEATLATTDGKVEVEAKSGKVEVTPKDIVALRNKAEQRSYERLLSPGFTDLWAGTATIGWAGTRGNARTATFTTSMSAARQTNRDKTSIYFNTIRASALVTGVNQKTAQAVRGGWGYNRNVSKRMFVNTFNDWEYDRFQNLDLRTVLGGGLGYMAWKGEKGRLDLVGGAAWNREKFDPAPLPTFVRNSAEAYWGDDFTYNLNARTSLFQNFRMFNNLSNTGQYRVNMDVGARMQLLKWLTWNVSVSDRYLSNPVSGRLNNDFLYTTGFGISFAR
jgi:putative salt-induced outer membrane protein YdiY